MASVYDRASLAYGTDTNIRLIELLSGSVFSENTQSKVHCKFHIVPLASRPVYTAISYMWGDNCETFDIVLDGRTFPVRANLFGLLKTLSKEGMGLLWVDAICIDQSSISERNHQVSLMGQIYSQAKDVIVWLGGDDERVTEALKRVQASKYQEKDDSKEGVDDVWTEPSILSGLSALTRAWLYGPLTRFPKLNIWRSEFPRPNPYIEELDVFLKLRSTTDPLSMLDEQSTMPEGPEIWPLTAQLSALCLNPYWTRAWIVQELILAQTVHLQSGQTRISLESLDDLLQELRQWTKTRKYIPAPAILLGVLNSHAAELLAKRNKWQASSGRSYINPWDSGLGHLGCADVRDRVYAMGALMDRSITITPDYRKTRAQVFEEIFEQHLQRTGTFSGLVWNLQGMLELDGEEPVVKRAREFGSFEWAPKGTLTGRDQ